MAAIRPRRSPIVALALLAAACTSGQRSGPSHPPPGYQGPPPGYHAPPPGQPPAPAPQAALPWWMPTFTLPQPPPALGVFRPINVSSLVANLSRSPCAPVEVSPGNWVGLDCTPPTFITRALVFQRPRAFFNATGSLPDGVDHRAEGYEGPMKNQGAVGTCTAVSLSTAMEHALRRMGVQDPVSALHIWSQYGQPSMGQAGDSTLDKRLSAEAVWPYDPAAACKMMRHSNDSCGYAYDVQPNSADSDPQLQAKRQAADGAGRYHLIGIERLPNHDPNEFAAILAGGEDIWVAFNVNSPAWQNKNMVNHVIQDYSTTEATGHAVVLSGYRTVGGRKQFLIHNSWGPSWGDNGYAWIGENMVRDQLRYGYRVRVANPGGGPTPPSPQPTTGGCPQGQAMDSIYKQCMPACSNGTAPTAGLCLPAFPGGPQPQPQPSGGCPAGQAKDALSGQCKPACAGGLPPIGGLCLPQLQ